MNEEKKEEIPPSVFAALQRSGFPFQTAVAHVVRSIKGWSVHASEYPWKDPAGKDEFLDVVITNGDLFATLECKKSEKEILTFLRPLGGGASTGLYERVRCLRGASNYRLVCEDWALWPNSYESEFCVISMSTSGEGRVLERIARLVVYATDALAINQEKRFEARRDPPPKADRIYFSIIVTNAPLYTVRYSPKEVSLRSGKFETRPEDIKPGDRERVPWIRFRKAFTSPVGIHLDERTVFVVHAENLGEFLGLLEKSPTDDRQERNPLPIHVRT